jgi:hypothetical protein
MPGITTPHAASSKRGGTLADMSVTDPAHLRGTGLRFRFVRSAASSRVPRGSEGSFTVGQTLSLFCNFFSEPEVVDHETSDKPNGGYG